MYKKLLIFLLLGCSISKKQSESETVMDRPKKPIESKLMADFGPFKEVRWPNPKDIPVCWEPLPYGIKNDHEVIPGWNINRYKKEVQTVVTREYAKADIHFTQWQECKDNSVGVRIFLSLSTGQSPIGYNSVLKANTIVLGVFAKNFALNERFFRKTALHEFGHTLGFLHEDDRRDTEPDCKENDSLSDMLSSNTVQIGDYDSSSIMSYCITSKHPALHGKPYPINFEDGQQLDLHLSVLSKKDIGKMKAAYFRPIALFKEKPRLLLDSTAKLIEIDGKNISSYKYAFGKAGKLDCKNPSTYSEPRSPSKPVDLSLDQLVGKWVKICLVGSNQSGDWQPWDTYTSISWKVVKGPVVDLTESLTEVYEQNKHLKFKMRDDLRGIMLKSGDPDLDCTKQDGYVQVDNFEAGYDLQLSGMDPGIVKLCLLGKGKDGWGHLDEASSYSFLFLKGNALENLQGLPVSKNDRWETVEDTISVDQHDHLSLLPETMTASPERVRLRSKTANEKKDCFDESGYSAPFPAGKVFRPDTISDLSSPTEIYLCVQSEFDGQWQSIENALVKHWTVSPSPLKKDEL